MRLCGRAQAWWQQTKQNRTRMGKAKINSWEKFKKHMRSAFLPYNYERELYQLYQRFQLLRQGNRMITPLNFMNCLRALKLQNLLFNLFLNTSAACTRNFVMFLICLTL